METEKPKRGRTGRTSVIILLILAAAYLVTSMRCGEPIRTLPETRDLRDGDILLLGSSTIRGRILKFLDGGSKWGHCGIAVAPNMIAHADPKKGVVCQSIGEYLAENDVDCICMLRPSTGNGKVAAAFALNCAQSGIGFDDSFGYKNGGGIYCTELVLLAWESADVKILPDATPGDRIAPSRILDGTNTIHVWNTPSS